jgi:hypothetical protein
MTHDELLAKIDNYTCCSEAHELALRAVVELHKPIISTAFPEFLGICLACTPLSLNFYEAIRYPCPTIQTIEKELK